MTSKLFFFKIITNKKYSQIVNTELIILQENIQTIILYVKEKSFHNFGIQRWRNNKDNVKDMDKHK